MGNTGPRSKLEPYDEEIRRLYVDEGKTDQHVADELPIEASAEAIRMRRKALGIPTNRVRKTGRYIMKSQYNTIKDELPQAWEDSKRFHPVYKRLVGSAERVGKQYGVSGSTAYEWLVRVGVLPPRPSYDRDAPKALALFEAGYSVPRIAKEMEVEVDTIRGWLKRKGVDLQEQHSSARMSHEEKMAWRRAISAGKIQSVAGSGRFNYNGTRLDSTYEVRFVTSCDRLGLEWRAYDRALDGVCEVDVDGKIVRYAPDIMVKSPGGHLPVEIKGIYDALAATKVKAWRNQPGRPDLAMMMRQEILDFEEARTIPDAMAVLEAALYLDPPTDPAYWD